MNEVERQPVKAAFEVKKGIRQVMTLSEADVEKYLDPRELLTGLEDGFRGLELGEIQSPPRPKLSVAGKGFFLAMAAWRPGMQLTIRPTPVGCGELAGLDPSMGTTLGAVVLGRKPGQLTDAEITVYKAMGIAMEDMIAANLAYQTAKREGGGGAMAW